MADYWKSQPRKFCQYCKCWIADNKPSIEFHERGKNHKENVAAKITEIKKKSIAKAKQEERMSKDFAAMEEAAMKAYQEDLKRMEREAAGLPEITTTQPKPQPQVRPQVKTQAKKQQKKGKGNKQPHRQPAAQAPVWVEGRTDDGHVYYYNTVTGESTWEKPDDFQGETSAQPAQTESSSGFPWMEALSPDGYTYYYNSETGETSWEKPADFPSVEEPASGSNAEGESQEEPEPEPEPLSGGDESSDGAPATQEPEVPEPSGQSSNTPKISFRKRKAESEPTEREGEEKVGEDAPKEETEEVKKEEEEEEEEVQSSTAEPEEKKEAAPVTIQAKRPKTTNPYGAWEQIQEEEDPYSKVDLQLPQVDGSSGGAPADLPPEPKPKFKERIITSLGQEGGPASFRKNKAQNGKSRSLRQRDDDD